MKKLFVSAKISNKMYIGEIKKKEIVFPCLQNVKIMLFRRDQKIIDEILKESLYYRKNYYRLFVKLDREYARERLLDYMLQETGMTYKRLCSDFKRLTGTTPGEYIMILRAYKAAFLLMNSTLPVESIAFDSGFSALSNFRRVVNKYLGKAPRELRNKG